MRVRAPHPQLAMLQTLEAEHGHQTELRAAAAVLESFIKEQQVTSPTPMGPHLSPMGPYT